MADHDGAYHRLFSIPRLVRELLTDVIKPPWLPLIDLSTLERVNIKLHGKGLKGTGISRKEGDMLWRAQSWDGAPIYIYLALEFQSRSFFFMALRFQVYTGFLSEHLRQEKLLDNGRLPPIYPVVLYNGLKPWSAPTQLRDLFAVSPSSPFYDFLPNLSYYVVDELRHPIDEASPGASILLAILRLERCQDASDVISCMQALSAALKKDLDGTVLEAVTQFLGAARLPPIFDTLDGNLGSYINPENTMLLEKRVRQWEAQLVRKGKSEGRKEGRRDGLKRGKVQSICRFLEARFGDLPSDIELKLKDIDDLAELDTLAVAAATVPNLGEFLRVVP